jgi:hypothetical protein
MNNFLLRVRGRAKRQFPPAYLLTRGARKLGEERESLELSFEANEVIKVRERCLLFCFSPLCIQVLAAPAKGGWWKGKLSSQKIGWFPVAHTQEMAPSELAANNSNDGSQ